MPFFRGSLNALAGEHVCSLDGCLCQAGEYYHKHGEWACADRAGCFQVPAKQFLLCFNLSMFTGARAEAWGEQGLALHSPGSEPHVQAEMPTGFQGAAPRELTPVVVSAPASCTPRDGAAVRGWAVLCLGTWEGERGPSRLPRTGVDAHVLRWEPRDPDDANARSPGLALHIPYLQDPVSPTQAGSRVTEEAAKAQRAGLVFTDGCLLGMYSGLWKAH